MKEACPTISKQIESYTEVQNIAKRVMAQLLDYIQEGVTEVDIAQKAKELLAASGISESWYYDIPAFVLVGERTILSLSGRDYVPSETSVRANDLVTIDLSPKMGNFWGDYARSIFVEDGEAKLIPTASHLTAGFNCEAALHHHLIETAHPDMTAHDLWAMMNDLIDKMGFRNLDFRGNLGHSIETKSENRRFIESGNQESLGSLEIFTFEPHIAPKGDNTHGFKHENIYVFKGHKLEPL